MTRRQSAHAVRQHGFSTSLSKQWSKNKFPLQFTGLANVDFDDVSDYDNIIVVTDVNYHSIDGIGSVAYVVYNEYEDHNGDAGIGDAGDD